MQLTKRHHYSEGPQTELQLINITVPLNHQSQQTMATDLTTELPTQKKNKKTKPRCPTAKSCSSATPPSLNQSPTLPSSPLSTK